MLNIDLTRPIHLSENVDVDDYEFMEIHQHTYNMVNYLRRAILNTCSECKKNFKDNEIKKLKCLCLYCEACLEKKHNEATHNLKVLNIYEIKQNTHFKCNCDKVFDTEEVCLLIKNVTEEHYIEAQRRLTQKIKTLCMFCGTPVCQIDQAGKINNLKPNRKIKIADEKDHKDKFIETRHVACDACYNTHLAQGAKEGTRGENNDKMCVICHKVHHIINTNNSETCLDGCVVY